MKQKINLTLLLLVGLTTVAQAQRFTNSAGVTGEFIYGTVRGAAPKSNNLILAPYYITYSPRFNMLETESTSLSISAPVGIYIGGYSGTVTNSQFGFSSTINDNGWLFGYDLPVVLDFNLGKGAIRDNDSRLGAYIGTGYSYSRFNIFGSHYSNYHGTSIGPLIRGGVRLRLGASAIGSFGLFYKQGREHEQFKTIGFNFLCCDL